MRKFNKILCVMTVTTFILSNCINVFATNVSSGKEEVVYVMTNLDGSTKYVYAVNIFNGGDILDYGDYSQVKILNTNDKIQVNEDEIKIKSNADKVYYEGTMEKNDIPWNISVRYFLDDKEVFGNELGGKNGRLKIKLNINKNENYTNDSFFENYALQVILKFDTDISKNINSNGATVANIGKKKQLLYTILPGKSLNTEITSDVTDFEMDAIEINGVKMSFNIDVDSSAFNGEVDSLKDGIAEIDNGANKVKNAINDAKNGGNKLNDGVNSLKNGTDSLDQGIDKLKNGIEIANDGLKTLNEKSDVLASSSNEFKNALLEIQKSISQISEMTDNLGKLSSESSKINQGINSIYEGNQALYDKIGYDKFKMELSQKGLDLESFKSKNVELSNRIKSEIGNLTSQIASLEENGRNNEADQIRKQIEILEQVAVTLTVNNEIFNGMEVYLEALKNGEKQILDSMFELKSNYEKFDMAIQNISNNLVNMVSTVNKFANVINQLVDKYSKLDAGIVEYTQGVKKLYSGYGEIVNGIYEISKGSKSLKNGVNELGNGSLKLKNGLNDLHSGSVKLNDGTITLRNKTLNLDTKIEDKINEMLATIKGDSREITSFTSPKNTNVKSVQFVIKSDSIIRPKVEKDNMKDEENLGFWDKFLNLFKKKN